MNLEKLSAAPWRASGCDKHSEIRNPVLSCFMVRGPNGPAQSVDDKEFAALARNAFDVMMRRGWTVKKLYPDKSEWGIETRKGWWFENASQNGESMNSLCWYPDPFTALVEADKWYVANVEKE